MVGAATARDRAGPNAKSPLQGAGFQGEDLYKGWTGTGQRALRTKRNQDGGEPYGLLSVFRKSSMPLLSSL
ncbi:hypothetical protein Hsc_3379 [Herbaspirillum seropedicae]|nr:hypothetical protein Hsc_3379 [Herbaspirillum seropedicae]